MQQSPVFTLRQFAIRRACLRQCEVLCERDDAVELLVSLHEAIQAVPRELFGGDVAGPEHFCQRTNGEP